MKKIYATISAVILSLSANAQGFWENVPYKGAFPVTDNTAATDWTDGWANFDPENTNYGTPTTTVQTDVTANATWSGIVLLKNKVYVKDGVTLTIQPGTIIRGDKTTQGTLIVSKGGKIIAEGTASQPIVFTSSEAAGNRAEGDWGGLVILGKAKNNQPGGVANIEGITATPDTQYGGTNDDDNSGSLKYVRIEFPGIALQPNKEINGLTFGSVGRATQVDYIQVSFSGDDSFEWFGGTVDCKHLIAYRGLDDDFDTDFGYRGRVQFGLIIRDKDLSDAAGDSNAFESDNDATGSTALPRTKPVFSNITIVGPKGDGTGTLPGGEKFEKAFRLRRNTSTSVYNSLIVGWEKGLSIEGNEDNYLASGADSTTVFAHNNVLAGFTTLTNCVTASPAFYSTMFGAQMNDTTTTVAQIAWVSLFPALGTKPDARLSASSTVKTGALFPSTVFDGFLGTNEIEFLNGMVVYPNPANSILNVKLNENQNVNTQVVNMQGQVLITNEINEFGQININELASGVYQLILTDGKALKNVRFIKQ